MKRITRDNMRHYTRIAKEEIANGVELMLAHGIARDTVEQAIETRLRNKRQKKARDKLIESHNFDVSSYVSLERYD